MKYFVLVILFIHAVQSILVFDEQFKRGLDFSVWQHELVRDIVSNPPLFYRTQNADQL